MEARQELESAWGRDIVKEIDSVQKFKGTINDFLDNCVACGGNWGGMLLSGVRNLYPTVYALVPDKLGKTNGEAFDNIVNLIEALGVQWG